MKPTVVCFPNQDIEKQRLLLAIPDVYGMTRIKDRKSLDKFTMFGIPNTKFPGKHMKPI
jgi:hypothetical protein